MCSVVLNLHFFTIPGYFSGHIDHSTKIMQVITWNRSFKNLPDQEDLVGNFEIDFRFETHATVLDLMLAWEKKLYDEVKVMFIKLNYFLRIAYSFAKILLNFWFIHVPFRCQNISAFGLASLVMF